MSEEVRPCFICGHVAGVAYPEKIEESQISEFTYASRKRPELMHYEYRECLDCALLFSSNLPTTDNLLDAYHEASFDSPVESQYAARTYANELGAILRPGISVLDVGCGDGTFLDECLSRGVASIQGIEPSPAAADLASERVRPHIFLGGHEQYDGDQDFDLVTLFQTVEHIRDPLGFIEGMRRLARPGGHLAIACHNYQSPVNRVLGERSPIFDIEHLQIFSSRSIAKLMERVGLRLVAVGPYANTYPLSYWMRLSPLPGSIKETRWVTSGRMGKTPVRVRVGNTMAIGQFPK